MKVLASVLLLLSFAMSAFADQSTLMLSTSKASYTAGNRAVLIARAVFSPADSKKEYVFKAKLNTANIKITSISPAVAYTVTNELPAGNYTWEVQTFVQNKVDAQRLNETIVFYEQEVRELQRKIAAETNAQVLAMLNAQVVRDNSIILRTQSQLDKIRTSVGVKTISFVVNSVTKNLFNRTMPTVTVTADSSTGIYFVGATAQFTIELNSLSVEGEEADWLFDAGIPALGEKPAIALNKTENSPTSSTFTTTAFDAASSGWRELVPQLKYRLKSQLVKFKEAIGLAVTRKNEYIHLKNQTNDPKRTAYYQSLIAEVDLLISALTDLGLSFQNYPATAFEFKIKDPGLAKGFDIVVSNIDVLEGGAPREVKIRLKSDPDTDVNVNFTIVGELEPIPSIVFNSHNWNQYQSIYVVAIDDDIQEDFEVAKITLNVATGDYLGVSKYFTVRIADNDPFWNSISVGGSSVCGTKESGVFCWGQNESGQLGTGDTSVKMVPTKVTGLQGYFTPISGTDQHMCTVNTNMGTIAVYCWGRNNLGQLGVGSTINYSTPQKITIPGTPTQVKAAYRHTCAVSSGKLYCWGDNSSGQLGLGVTTSSFTTPQLVPGFTNVASVSLGSSNTCFKSVTPAGVYCMGDNASGQIGDGTYTTRRSPTLVTGSTSNDQVVVSGFSNMACMYSPYGGYIKCWGDGMNNGFGNNGGTNYSPVPVNVSVTNPAEGIGQLTVGLQSGCYTNFEQTKLKCWGNNSFGNLGSGNTTSAPVPQDINFSFTWVESISTSGYSTCGSFWIVDHFEGRCWGDGSNYVLGTGNDLDQLLPTPIVEPANFKKNHRF